eukprot:Clim_evm12s221 gene=Clim_evmTU12s221
MTTDPALAFDYDNSEEWKAFLNRLEFPGNPTEAQILKAKRKFYKRHVDPNYEPSPGTGSTDTEIRQRRTEGSSTTEPPRQEQSPGQGQSPRQEQPQARQGTTESGRQHTHARNDESVSIGPLNTRVLYRQFKADPMRAVTFACDIWVLCNAALLIVNPLFSFAEGFELFKNLIKGAFLNYLICVVRTHGWPMSHPQGFMAYLEAVKGDLNFHYLLFCFVWLIGSNSTVLLAIAPLVIFTAYGFSGHCKRYLVAGWPNVHRSLIPYHDWLASKQQEALGIVASVEVALCPAILLFVLFGYFSILFSIPYFHFMRLRYRYSALTRLQMQQLGHHIDGLAYSQNCPEILRRGWMQMRNWLRRASIP